MTNKIKLVAIAKDEAAYLPEWIFHHLYFGFDAIDIYVNNTQDNTAQIVEALYSESRVKFLDGDAFFTGEFEEPQEAVYLKAVTLAKNEGFTHVMFLDIDEFWTPKNFQDSIKSCLDYINADVVSFEWFLRTSEKESFSKPYEKVIEGSLASYVKSIFSLSVDIQKVGVHNIIATDATYKLADGSVFDFQNKRNAQVSIEEKRKGLKDYFVIHRMFRSEMEYISLLGRGRPKKDSSLTSMFKNNRHGYCVNKNLVEFKPTPFLLENYQNELTKFLNKYQLCNSIQIAQKYVEGRYFKVLNLIAFAPSKESQTLKQILKNVSLPAVIASFNNFLSCHITPSDINTLRDAAIKLEKSNLLDAFKLMLIAQQARPTGEVINKKIQQYKIALKIK